MGKPVYMDYQATAPLDPRVAAAMQPYWSDMYGNPHSEGHSYGRDARRAVEFARSQIADFIGADDEEIIFTSGATESCNMALRGVAFAAGPNARRNGIAAPATEHAAVLDTVKWLETQGFAARILPVDADGLLDMDALESVLCGGETLLASVMLVNNEIGVVQPLAEISALCRAAGTFLHTDAAQAGGRVNIDVEELGVDMLSLSAHKIYGPKGIGALYIRNRDDLRIAPILTGGGQERGLRPGTVPAPLAVGMGAACALAAEALESESARLADLGARLLRELRRRVPNLRTFGHMEKRAPGSLSVGVPGVLAERVVDAASKHVAVSAGAACSAGSPEPSHVLTALGIDAETASCAVRISVGRFTAEAEADAAAASLARAFSAAAKGMD